MICSVCFCFYLYGVKSVFAVRHSFFIINSYFEV